MIRQRRVVLLCLAAIVGAILWGALHTPWYLEWRYARLTLPELEGALGDRMDDPRLLYYVGLRLNQQGRFAEADPILRQAVGLDPDSPRLRDEWARALLGSGLTTAAFGQLSQFAGTHPDSASAHLILGKFYFTQKSMKRAEEELERAVSLDGDLGRGWAYLAGARQGLGKTASAFEAAKKAAALRPRNANDQILLAFLSASLNRPADARRAYERAIALAPEKAIAHREYAVWLLKAGTGNRDTLLAESEARRAVQLDDKDADAHLALGRALVRNGKTEQATLPLARAASLAPSNPAPALVLAQTWRNLGQATEASNWEKVYLARQQRVGESARLRNAIRIDPDAREPQRRMARFLGLQGDVAGAVRHHAKALKTPLDSPPTLIAAANDLTDGGHAEKALPLAQRAVDVGPSNPAAHEALGNVLLGMGKVYEAALEYDKTISWLPQRRPILRERLERYKLSRRAATAEAQPGTPARPGAPKEP